MKKKLLLQDISDYIAQQEGISKKDADTFVRAFFEVIEQGLLEENFVKIKGLGTFKLVTVSERESVNINTGERFQISSHTKVTFTPDSSMKELVNRPFAHFETVDLSDETSTTELDQIDQAMLESLEAEDAEGDTEEDMEDLPEETPTTDEATDEEETLEATEEDVPSCVAEVDEETAVTVSEPVTAIQHTTESEDDSADSPGNETPSVTIEVPISQEEEDVPSSEELKEKASTEGNASSTENPTNQQLPSSSETQVETSKASPTSPKEENELADDPANGQKEEDLVVTNPKTIHSCTDAETMRTLDQGNPTLSYTYRETPAHRKHNIWKTIALVCLVGLLMGLSYFAGYFKVLCPCSYPILENWLTPFLTEQPAPSTPAPTPLCPQNPVKKEATSTSQTGTPSPSPSAVDQPAEKTEAKETTSPQAEQPVSQTPQEPEKKVETTASAPTAPPKAPDTSKKQEKEKPRTHVVRKGDNLSKIARRYYGSDKYVRAIMKRNKLSDADNIELGTTLYLP